MPMLHRRSADRWDSSAGCRLKLFSLVVPFSQVRTSEVLRISGCVSVSVALAGRTSTRSGISVSTCSQTFRSEIRETVINVPLTFTPSPTRHLKLKGIFSHSDSDSVCCLVPSPSPF